MGITTPLSNAKLAQLDVLHLIGGAVPAKLSFGPFVLYQNMVPPESTLSAGLVLPATAFSEEDGTFVDHAGAMHEMHKAVDAPGSALPSWQIVCRIAQKLEVPGFAYDNEEQIRAEMVSLSVTSTSLEPSVLSLFRPESAVFPSSQQNDHGYMGYPLRKWVPGFQALCPEPTLRVK